MVFNNGNLKPKGKMSLVIIVTALLAMAIAGSLLGCSSASKEDIKEQVEDNIENVLGDDGGESSVAEGSDAQDADEASESSDGIVVPDFVGKKLSDVKQELKLFDVKYQKEDGSKANVIVKSNWAVLEQSLEAGSTVEKGSELILRLKHYPKDGDESESAAEDEQEANIEYIPVSAEQLLDDLNSNALNAKEYYKNGYFCISGVLSNIDASGRYIDINPEGQEYNFTPIQCYINDEDVKDQVRQHAIGDYVSVYGQVTEVGEVMGYSVDINSIE